jgi:hypothetical protein
MDYDRLLKRLQFYVGKRIEINLNNSTHYATINTIEVIEEQYMVQMGGLKLSCTILASPMKGQIVIEGCADLDCTDLSHMLWGLMNNTNTTLITSKQTYSQQTHRLSMRILIPEESRHDEKANSVLLDTGADSLEIADIRHFFVKPVLAFQNFMREKGIQVDSGKAEKYFEDYF